MDLDKLLEELKTFSLEDKLYLTQFSADKESHLKVDQTKCKECETKICTTICPVENYKEEDGEIVVSFEGCLECGTCRIACRDGSITWEYPRGGFGVCYRFG